MKRIKNADINFKLNPKRINLNSFSMKFYTVNSEAYFFIKDQDNLVSVERDATIYDEDVIISGGTKVLDYYLPLDWSELVQLGEGVLNYRCINNIEDPYFPDMAYNQVVEDTTGYYIDSDIIVDPSQTRNIIERVTELESGLAVESIDREEADTFISGAVDTEVARAISAETELSERIDEIESGASEALDAEIERAISAETALQDAIDAEEARAIAIENAIRQDLTDESELRSSADTAMWTAINDEIVRSTSAETALDNKVEVETLRAIGVENAISGDLQTYKATNNAALQAETTRATSAETALQSAINDEATARANADTALQTAITNEVSRAREAESGITNSLNAEVTRATGAENALDDKIDAETTRATGAEAALDVKIGTVSGNVITETTRATTAENALSGAIDSISAATSGSVEELAAKIDTVSGNVITEEARAKGVEDVLSGAIDTLDAKFIDDAKYEMSGQTHVINFYNGNVVKATIDCTDFLVDGMIDDVRIETISGVTYLVIDFNTASGKEDIKIPLTDIFNPANYYTKSETSGATEISTALAQKLAISDFNTYSGAVDTAINSKASQSTVDALNGVVTAHTADTSIHVTSNDKEKWNKVDDKADTTALTAVNDALTAHTADSVAHITAAERTAWNAKADESAFTAHTADINIHLSSGDIQSQINNSISGKANSSDVYLKSETSGATELATAFAAKQNQLIAGENITISGNVISSQGGGSSYSAGTGINIFGDVITAVYDGYMSYDNPQQTVNDFTGELYIVTPWKDCYEQETGQCYIYTAEYSSNYQYLFSFNPTTKQYEIIEYPEGKENDWQNYFTLEFVEKYGIFKLTTIQQVAYISDNGCVRLLRIGDGYNDYSFKYSGTTEDAFNGVIDEFNGCVYYVGFNNNEKELILFSNKKNNSQESSSIQLDDLKYDGALKTDIKIPLGTSGWTEVTNLSENSCQLSDSKVKGFTTFRISGDTTQLNNWNLSIAVGYNFNYTWDSVNWDDNENTFVLNVGWSDIFSAATATWDSQTGYLTISYPQTVIVDGEERQTEFYYINSQQCQYGYVISKFEYYAELQQPLKPYVQQLRTDVNTISGQVATKQDTLIAGSNITISGNVISVTGGTGGGISSAECQTMIESATTPICQTIEDNEQVTAQALNVLNGELANKLDVSAYTPVDLSNYYTKSETSGATELSTAFAATQPKLSAGTGISIDANNVISATGGGSITIDPTLDSGSTNAVANSAITNAINTVSGDSVCNCRDIVNVESSDSEILTVFETNSGGILPNGIYRRFRMPLYIDTTDDYRLKLAINTAVTSASTDSQIPSAKAVYDALGSASGGITSGEVQTMIDQSISGKTNQSDFTGHTANTTAHVTQSEKNTWNAKSDFSGSYNDLTDKPTIPTVPTSNTAFTNDAGYITANDITGKTDVTAFTAHTGDTTIHVTSSDKTSWNGAATNASNAVTALGGLSLVKLTQAQYDALATKDNNTLYVIVG